MAKKTEIEKFLGMAKEWSTNSTCLKRQYGAVIVKNGVIISEGYNGAAKGCKECKGKCHRMNVPSNSGDYRGCKAVHAEMNAIIHGAYTDMIGADIYLYGTNADGSEIDNPYPCPICELLIINAGIKRIINNKSIGTVEKGEIVWDIREDLKPVQADLFDLFDNIIDVHNEYVPPMFRMSADPAIISIPKGPELYYQTGIDLNDNIIESLKKNIFNILNVEQDNKITKTFDKNKLNNEAFKKDRLLNEILILDSALAKDHDNLDIVSKIHVLFSQLITNYKDILTDEDEHKLKSLYYFTSDVCRKYLSNQSLYKDYTSLQNNRPLFTGYIPKKYFK